MKTKVIKVGNSKGILLPKHIIKVYEIQDEIQLELREDCIVLTPLKDTKLNWEALYQKELNSKTDDQDKKDWQNFPNKFDEEEWTW
jgi:antitoxin MazE